MSEFSQEADQLTEDLKTDLYYCKLGDHNALAHETYVNPKGRRFCKLHKHQVKLAPHLLGNYREGKPNGKLSVCLKPPTLCTSQFLVIDYIAKGKRRLKVYCIEQPFKSCLLDAPKKPL